MRRPARRGAPGLVAEASRTLEQGVRQARDLGWSQRRIASVLGRSQPEVKRLAERAGRGAPGDGAPVAQPTLVLDGVLRVHRDEIVATAARYGAHNVRVFGSVASGTERPTSDVDLLVDTDEHVGLIGLSSLALELEGILRRPVDVVPESSLKPSVRETVQAIAL